MMNIIIVGARSGRGRMPHPRVQPVQEHGTKRRSKSAAERVQAAACWGNCPQVSNLYTDTLMHSFIHYLTCTLHYILTYTYITYHTYFTCITWNTYIIYVTYMTYMT